MAISLAALLAAPLALPAQASASADDKAVGQNRNPDRIVITGTRSDEALDNQPYAISVIELERIKRELPRTVPEALNALPGVLVQKTASGHGSPYIRGFTGNRTLLVIDGIRYNNATFRDGANEYFAQIDTFVLGQIELIAGPSSALYGSEAVGGVLNLTTRNTPMSDHSGRFFGAEQTVRVSSGDQSVASRTAFTLGHGGRWGLRGGATVREYGDIRAADLGRLPNTGYSERAVDGRLDIALSPRWTTTIHSQSMWQDDVPRTHSTAFSLPFAGTVSGTDLRRDKDHGRGLTYLKVRGASNGNWWRSLELTLSHQFRSEEERRVRSDGGASEQSFDSDLFALNAVARSEIAGLDLTFGIDLSTERIDSARTDTDSATGSVTVRLQGPVGTDARYDQAGAFVRGIASLSSSLSLEGSLRLSLIDTTVGQFADPITDLPRSFQRSWSDVSGSLRASYQVGAQTLWAGYSRSFRAPNVADVSRFGRSRSSEVEVASVDLEPETFDTFEIGVRGDLGAIDLGLNAYTTRLNEFIATMPTGRIRDGLIEVAKRNAASGHVTGIELLLNADLGSGFVLTSNATLLRGRLSAQSALGSIREPISRIQPLTGNLRLSWERRSEWVVAELILAGRADQLSSGDLLDLERIPPGGTPGFAVLNMRGGLDLRAGLALTLALNNLLDEAYRTHGSGNNEPGRHVFAGLRLAF